MSPKATIRKAPPNARKKRTTSDPDQYTDPELRERIKREVTAGDKGGKAGQWSARKAQLVAAEYEKQGGGYKHERSEAQEHLHEWTEEHWQTSDGRPAERDGSTTRYLPKEAWDKLSAAEKSATNRKKVQGSRRGKQVVSNTAAAAKARKEASVPEASKPARKRAERTSSKRSGAGSNGSGARQ